MILSSFWECGTPPSDLGFNKAWKNLLPACRGRKLGTHLNRFREMTLQWMSSFLGPREPLGTPSFVRPFVRPLKGNKNLDQLYSSINHHRTTANPSDQIFSESHHPLIHDDALMQLMRWCTILQMCWCTHLADALILLMYWSCRCPDPAYALILLMRWCADAADATESGPGSACGPFESNLL